ncbi:MAG: hypothetical protein ACFCUJ_16175 [Thiotrichales bacterium]
MKHRSNGSAPFAGDRPHRAEASEDAPPRSQDPYIDQLRAALHSSPSPDLLPQRHTAADASERRVRRRFYAITACAVAAVLLGSMVTWSYQTTHDLPHRLLQIVQSLDDSFGKSDPGLATDGLAKVGTPIATQSAVSQFKPCVLAGMECSHLTLDTPYGRVVATLLPNHVVQREARVVHRGLISVLRPASQGSYALIGNTDKAVAAAETLLADRLQRRI